MKYLVVLLVIGAVFWLWRHNRRQDIREAQAQQQASRVPQAMVRCAHCGVHLARQDALQQRGQWYCGQEHAQQARQAARKDTA